MASLMEAGMLGIALVVFVVVLGVGGQVLDQLRNSQFTTATDANCANGAHPSWVNCSTAASNATGSGLSGLANMSSQSGTIGLILGAVVIIGLLMGAFMARSR